MNLRNYVPGDVFSKSYPERQEIWNWSGVTSSKLTWMPSGDRILKIFKWPRVKGHLNSAFPLNVERRRATKWSKRNRFTCTLKGHQPRCINNVHDATFRLIINKFNWNVVNLMFTRLNIVMQFIVSLFCLLSLYLPNTWRLWLHFTKGGDFLNYWDCKKRFSVKKEQYYHAIKWCLNCDHGIVISCHVVLHDVSLK